MSWPASKHLAQVTIPRMHKLVDRIRAELPDVDDFSPERLLQSGELKAVRALYRRQPELHELPPWNAKEPLTKKDEKIRRAWHECNEQLNRLAAAVMQRECGIEKYMVLHLVRDDGYEVWLQVETVELMNGFGSLANRLAWKLEGSALRKDKTIGYRRTGIGFTFARVDRRQLDGRWIRIRSGSARAI
jgi:hypothetical protein